MDEVGVDSIGWKLESDASRDQISDNSEKELERKF